MPLPRSTRREFLKRSGSGLGLLALGQCLPSFLLPTSLGAGAVHTNGLPVLVVVRLTGGNDGLNTVIPYADDNYYRLRPTLAIDRSHVLPISETLGLHPACGKMQALFKSGKMTVVQNVGYPQPSRSHARATEIWESGSNSNEVLSTGWLGRYLDTLAGDAGVDHGPLGIHFTPECPLALTASTEPRAIQWGSPSLIHVGSHSTAKYPDGNFGHALRHIVDSVAAKFPARVYFVSLNGFDTHSHQANQHQNLLQTLSEGLFAFQQDLESQGIARQVLTMTYSEFGRSPAENENRGTDHGTSAPLFLIGSALQGGMVGTPPTLDLAPSQQLVPSTDFRQVYATLLEDWLVCPAESVLGNQFAKLELLNPITVHLPMP